MHLLYPQWQGAKGSAGVAKSKFRTDYEGGVVDDTAFSILVEALGRCLRKRQPVHSRESALLKQPDDRPGQIDFTPAKSEFGRCRVLMMVVVQSFASRQKR